MDLLLSAMLSFGARLARPGEFTERAFLNGKMDLAQAEAVADLIASRSEAAARSALRSLSGVFSERVRGLAQDMLDLRVYVEGAIDFPEDDVDFLAEGRVGERLERLVGDAGRADPDRYTRRNPERRRHAGASGSSERRQVESA